MPRIAGISTKKDAKGNIIQVTIDVKKHRKAIEPFLNKMGVTQDNDFEKEFAEGLSPDESLAESLRMMEKWVK